jgi:hypothetical protein
MALMTSAPLGADTAPPPAFVPGPAAPESRRWPYVLAAVLVTAVAAVAVQAVLRSGTKDLPALVVNASGRIEGREVTLAPKDIQGRVTDSSSMKATR